MTTNRINPCTLALAITIAIDATPQEVEDTIAKVRNFFDNGIAPTDIATVQQTVSVAGAIPAAAEAPADTNAPATDNTGMPWDERIHSSSKALTDKGVWRYRRNLDKSFIATTEAAIRAGLVGTAAAPVAAAAPAIPPPPVQAALPALGGLPPIPGAVAVNPEYTALLTFITENSPPLTPEYISGNLPAFGIADGSLQTLAHNPDAIKAFSAALHTALGK
jgi:hypothetical protein